MTLKGAVVAAICLTLASAEADRVRPAAAPESTVKLFRVILPVGNIDSAQRFYGELLGQPGRRVAPGRHYFDCGEVLLVIVEPRASGDDWDARPNQDHVYFAVGNLEEFHERAGRLGGLVGESKYGSPMGRIATRPWGERSFYMRDPFQNPLCFVDEKTVFTGR